MSMLRQDGCMGVSATLNPHTSVVMRVERSRNPTRASDNIFQGIENAYIACIPFKTMLDSQGWFWSVHLIYPHDTDYGGVVSHRAIVQWLEMARIQFAVAAGTSLPELLQQGTDLPVSSLNVTYLQAIPFGTEILLGAQLVQLRAPRLAWCYRIQDAAQTVYVQGRSDHAIVQVTEQGWRPHRRMPELLERCFRPVLVVPEEAI